MWTAPARNETTLSEKPTRKQKRYKSDQVITHLARGIFPQRSVAPRGLECEQHILLTPPRLNCEARTTGCHHPARRLPRFQAAALPRGGQRAPASEESRPAARAACASPAPRQWS